MAVRSFLHRHSTLCGFLAAAGHAALLGYLTRWSWPAVVLAAFSGICIFPRAFYGRAASRALDDSRAAPDSFAAEPGHGGYAPDMADIGTKSIRLEQAYESTKAAASGAYDVSGNADPDALRKFAEEEQREQA